MNARLSVHGSILASLVGALALAACGGASQSSTGSTSSTEESEALLAASESASTYDAQAEACAQTFLTCVSAANADIATCKSALESCLPSTPPTPPGCDVGDGGLPPPPAIGSGTDGGAPPPPPPPPAWADGGAPPPPPPFDGDGGIHGGPGNCGGPGGGQHGGPPPYCGKVPLPPPAALLACRETLESCMQGATDDTERKTCIEAERACAKAAFEAAGAP